MGGGGVQTSPLHFLKTIEGIDMELTPLIMHREIILLLLSAVTSHEVTKAPSWIFMAAILDFRTLSNAVKSYFFASNLLYNLIR